MINAITYDNEYYEIFGLSNASLNYYFDYYDITLQNHIDTRRLTNHYFSNLEYGQFLKSMLDLLEYL